MRDPPLRDRADLVRELGAERAVERLGRPTTSLERRAEAWFQETVDRGFQLICLEDDDYPRLLRLIHDPPLVLSVWGSLTLEDALSVAVVGSRRATAYGLEIGRRFGSELSELGLTIVSGLARGIDASAHEGALRARGRTLAVLGSGLVNLYPREHGRLAREVAAHGAVLSEFPPDEPPHARNFPRRNRIITGLTLGTLVVEAALKSGSLVSARLAMEQDREVFAVPGPARSRASEGTHALLRDGARLVTSAEHVVEELRPEIRALLREPSAAPTTGPDLTPDERHVYDTLSEGRAADLDTVMQKTALSADRVIAALSSLELKSAVLSLAGGLFQRKPQN